MYISRLWSRVLVISFTLLIAIRAADYQDVYRLQDALFTNYSTRIRPLLNQSDKINVTCFFRIYSILTLDEIQDNFIIKGFASLAWRDEILTWNPADYNGITTLSPDPGMVWRPRLQLMNSLDEIDMFEDKESRITLAYTGEALWLPGALFQTTCSPDLKLFPLDKHRCMLIFTPTYYDSKQLTFKPLTDKLDLSFYNPNGEWDLLGGGIDSNGIFMAEIGVLTPVLRVNFYIQRRPWFFMINVLVPVTILSWLNLLAFAIPVDSGEKLSFSVTVLLSYTIYMSIISNMLPTTSQNMPQIIYYVSLLFAIGVLISADIIIIVWLHSKEEFDERKQNRDSKLSNALKKLKNVKTFISSGMSSSPSPEIEVNLKPQSSLYPQTLGSFPGVNGSSSHTIFGKNRVFPIDVNGTRHSSHNDGQTKSKPDLKTDYDEAACGDEISTVHHFKMKPNVAENGEEFCNNQTRNAHDCVSSTGHPRLNKYKNMSANLNAYSFVIFTLATIATVITHIILIRDA